MSAPLSSSALQAGLLVTKNFQMWNFTIIKQSFTNIVFQNEIRGSVSAVVRSWVMFPFYAFLRMLTPTVLESLSLSAVLKSKDLSRPELGWIIDRVHSHVCDHSAVSHILGLLECNSLFKFDSQSMSTLFHKNGIKAVQLTSLTPSRKYLFYHSTGNLMPLNALIIFLETHSLYFMLCIMSIATLKVCFAPIILCRRLHLLLKQRDSVSSGLPVTSRWSSSWYCCN